MKKDYSKNVSMLCPVCGNDQFESLNPEYPDLKEAPDEVQLRCADCCAVYTKEDLIRENSEKIAIAADEMKDEIIKDFEKDFKKAIRKWKL